MEWMPCGDPDIIRVLLRDGVRRADRISVLAYNLFLAIKLLALPPSFFEGP